MKNYYLWYNSEYNGYSKAILFRDKNSLLDFMVDQLNNIAYNWDKSHINVDCIDAIKTVEPLEFDKDEYYKMIDVEVYKGKLIEIKLSDGCVISNFLNFYYRDCLLP